MSQPSASLGVISSERQGERSPYQQTADEVLVALGTDAHLGLSETEAQARLERFGSNGRMGVSVQILTGVEARGASDDGPGGE